MADENNDQKKKYPFYKYIDRNSTVYKGKDAGIRNAPGASVKDPITEMIYMPPEGAPAIREKLDNLERFMNDNNYSALDPLIKMAIIHYQFAAIHPFTAGNGSTGRILNGPLLSATGVAASTRFMPKLLYTEKQVPVLSVVEA